MPPPYPAPPRGPGAEKARRRAGKEALAGRAGSRRPRGWVSSLEAGAPRELAGGSESLTWREREMTAAAAVHLRARWASLHPWRSALLHAGGTGERRVSASGQLAKGSLSPVPPLVLPPKPLTSVSLPTFLNLLCQLFAPGRNKALLSGVYLNAIPQKM